MKFKDLFSGNMILQLLIVSVFVFQAVFDYKNYRLVQKKQALLLEHERLTQELEKQVDR